MNGIISFSKSVYEFLLYFKLFWINLSRVNITHPFMCILLFCFVVQIEKKDLKYTILIHFSRWRKLVKALFTLKFSLIGLMTYSIFMQESNLKYLQTQKLKRKSGKLSKQNIKDSNFASFCPYHPIQCTNQNHSCFTCINVYRHVLLWSWRTPAKPVE